VIIKHLDGKVLLNLRDEKPGIPFPNHWTLPGGRVESDETADRAAKRELHEETGLELPLSYWKIYERCHPDENIVVEQHVFVGEIDDATPQLVLGEGQALRFFARNEISSLSIAFGFKTLLEEFFDVHQRRVDRSNS
jgi:8-oxo-dGTP diphosphatase